MAAIMDCTWIANAWFIENVGYFPFYYSPGVWLNNLERDCMTISDTVVGTGIWQW